VEALTGIGFDGLVNEMVRRCPRHLIENYDQERKKNQPDPSLAETRSPLLGNEESPSHRKSAKHITADWHEVEMRRRQEEVSLLALSGDTTCLTLTIMEGDDS